MDYLDELSILKIFFISLLAIGILAAIILMIRTYMQGRKFKSNVRIDGKIVIITGSNTGIGKETAIDLARRGGKIYLACRDFKKSLETLEEIKIKSENNNVHFLQLDLASMESVRKFCKKFKQLESRLDILINNAGVMMCSKMKTKDDFELHFGTNHLGHFLLTNLLIDHLKVAAPSRIIVVSSLAYIFGKIKKNDLNNDRSYNKWLVYSSSKLANILFANELSQRLQGTGVVCNSLHPGMVHSNLQRHINFLRKLSAPFQWILFKETFNGAQTQIRLAVDPTLQTTSGQYFSDCMPTWTMKKARDKEMAKWLWNKSEQLTNLNQKF